MSDVFSNVVFVLFMISLNKFVMLVLIEKNYMRFLNGFFYYVG